MLGSDELAGLAEELDAENRIGTSLHCAECGYCLWKLPYVYTCPECGNAYNARPLSMKGIFFPHDSRFPASEIVALLVALAATFVLAAGAVEQVTPAPAAGAGLTGSAPAPSPSAAAPSPGDASTAPSGLEPEDDASVGPPVPPPEFARVARPRPQPVAAAPRAAPAPGGGLRPQWVITDPWRLVIAAFFLLLGVAYGWRIIRQVRRFIKGLVISHRIAADHD